MSLSRRSFLRGASSALGLAAAAVGGQRFSLLERVASAASLTGYTGYRALVGVFLVGGNDANNMIIPNTTAGYAKYAAHRTSANIGIPQASLLPIGDGTYGLHPKMPKLQGLFNTDKKLAAVFNVGTLVQPTSLAEYNQIVAGTLTTKRLPDHLFSHIDQQTEWTTAIPDPLTMFAAGPTAMTNTGWGGRMADLFAPLNPTVGGQVFPPLIWYGGTQVFGTGETQSPLAVASNGTLALSGSGSSATDKVRLTALTEAMSAQMKSGVAPVDAFTGSFTSALSFSGLRTAAIAGNPLNTAVGNPLAPIAALFPNTTLGNELLHITQDILAGASAAGSGLALKRQIFSASLGGFDTHTGELTTHNSLYAQVDDAFYAFYTAIEMLNAMVAAKTLPGVTQPLEVTLFTMSDFARTFLPNSSGGTDHGWGSHMLVLGDQVKGGATYGTFPDLTLLTDSAGALNDVGEGRWLPTTSSDQYANTLATWLGIASADQSYVFPRLGGFTTKSVGFMNP